MPGAVAGAVLLAAVLHAGWNALAHHIPDKLAALALMSVVYTALCLPLLVLLPAPAPAARPYLVASAALQVGYLLLLALAYRLGEFSQVYPLARGTAPLVVAMAAAVLVGERLPPTRLAGVLVVSAGLTTLVLSGGVPGRRELPAVLAAVATGLTIATYTVVDGVGVRRSGGVAGYAAWLFVLQGSVVAGYAAVRYGRALLPALHGHWLRGAAGGVLALAAYGLVLWAQSRGALAAVAALRETSVIVGAAIGAVAFRERFGPPRVAAAGLVALGVLLINR